MKKILVVDDSTFARSTLRQILKPAGYEVFEASSAFEAIELMASIRPDLVTLDLLMPEMAGDELLRHLRSVCNQCPLLIITADVQAITQTEMLAAGAGGYLIKPVRGDDLLAEVDRLISQAGQSSGLAG